MGLIDEKDTREDIKIGTGEGLEIVQVADDSPDDILKTDVMKLRQKFKKKEKKKIECIINSLILTRTLK